MTWAFVSTDDHSSYASRGVERRVWVRLGPNRLFSLEVRGRTNRALDDSPADREDVLVGRSLGTGYLGLGRGTGGGLGASVL